MPRRAKLTPGGREMGKVTRDLEQSGMTVRAYAEAKGLQESELWHWRRHLRERDRETAARPDSLPVIRLYFSSIAYSLIEALRRIGLEGTRMARAQCNTIRLKLLKVGTLIKITVRRVWVHLASSCPYQDLFLRAWRRVRIT